MGIDPGISPRFSSNPGSGAKILVTESYEHMFHRILDFRMKDSGFKKGLVLTGQPGIGLSPRLDIILVQQLTDTYTLQGNMPS